MSIFILLNLRAKFNADPFTYLCTYLVLYLFHTVTPESQLIVTRFCDKSDTSQKGIISALCSQVLKCLMNYLDGSQ